MRELMIPSGIHSPPSLYKLVSTMINGRPLCSPKSITSGGTLHSRDLFDAPVFRSFPLTGRLWERRKL